MRIFYPLPALPRNGGIKVCIQHSHLLNSHGHTSLIVTPEVCENPYPRYEQARFIQEDSCLDMVQPDDVFVFCWAESIRPYFHLDNRFLFFSQGVVNSTDPVHHTVWLNSRFELMVLGRHARDFFFYGHGKESQVITNWIDCSLFRPVSQQRVQRRVGLIEHREYADDKLHGLLKTRGYEVFPFKGTEEQIAQAMQSCDYFLSTAKGVFNGHDCAEGFALPSAEAMASGAILIGYNNQGCLSYAHDRVNSRIAWNSIPEELISLLDEVENDPEKERLRECGTFTIQKGFTGAVVYGQLKQALGL